MNKYYKNIVYNEDSWIEEFMFAFTNIFSDFFGGIGSDGHSEHTRYTCVLFGFLSM